ncbi:MAG: Ppx/GppA phosphatase family protein [Actinomycetota bacterium]
MAAIDVGTNSTRLLIAEAHRDAYRDLDRRLLFTRLGEGVDSAHRISPAALERTLGAIAEFCSVCGEFGVGQIRVAGTSAVRDAANAEEFLAAASQLSGGPAVALSGEQEAYLSFLGATADLESGPVLVCDIGGGSTELVSGTPGSGVTAHVSLDMGSVRMTERFLISDPPATEEVLTLEGAVEEMLEGAGEQLGQFAGAELVGLGGTITTLGALSAGIDSYMLTDVHRMTVDAGTLRELYAELGRMSTAQRERMPIMPPGRADVIVAGASILNCILRRWGFDRVVVSEKDVLDGLVLQMLAGSEP